jgi:hypothetical protein
MIRCGMTRREVVEVATEHVEASLPSEQSERFAAHIAHCTGCRAYLRELRTMLDIDHTVADREPVVPSTLLAHFPTGARPATQTPTDETHRGQTRQRCAAPIGAAHHDEGIAMATLCRAYTTEHEAHAAVDRLLSGGVSGAEVRVLMGDAVHDSRDAPVGSFVGTSTADDETVGAYAGVGHSGRDAMGSFSGDADEQRRGGFRDVDRETVTTYRDGVERVRIASHHNLEQMLLDAGLDEATAASDVEALHHGRILVLVQRAMALDELAGVIDA